MRAADDPRAPVLGLGVAMRRDVVRTEKREPDSESKKSHAAIVPKERRCAMRKFGVDQLCRKLVWDEVCDR